MRNFPDSGANGRLGLFVAPHSAFSYMNDDLQRAEVERMRDEDETYRHMNRDLPGYSVWNPPRPRVAHGLVAASTMLAAIAAVIVTSGPILTPGSSGISMRQRQVHPTVTTDFAVLSPARYAAGR